ncbi:MAG: hypothetical protein MI802_13610 [Desulfobacterales bacterium]|nr:hypothetical protein [Desulfobacterales bacterium]
MATYKSALLIGFRTIWQWIKEKITGGYGHITTRDEFDKAVLIEKYGFNRYL